ncbi:HNH endonuclease [Vibrio phage D69]
MMVVTLYKSRPKCTVPQRTNLAWKSGLSKKDRRQLYYKKCTGCQNESNGKPRHISNKPYVVHIDGNHSNNSIDNLQTLCANCHRLKTYLCGDYLARS